MAGVALGAVLAWHRLPSQSSSAVASVVTTRLKAPHSGLLDIADTKGFLVEEGLSSTFKATPTGYEAVGEVMRGEADFGTAAQTRIARTLAEGKQVRIVATIFSSQWNSAVVARGDRGITNPRDLKGKRVGFAGNGHALHAGQGGS